MSAANMEAPPACQADGGAETASICGVAGHDYSTAPPLSDEYVNGVQHGYELGRKDERADRLDDLSGREDAQPGRPRFRLVRVADLKVKQPRWLIRDLLEGDSLGLIFGDPGSLKSFLAIDWSCRIATGTDFHGRSVEQGPVVYIAGEGQNGLKRRFQAWSIRNQVSLDGVPLYASTMPAALTDEVSALEVSAEVDTVADESRESPSLVVIDTVARNFGAGDENSTQDMGAFIQAADMIRTRHQATVLLVHHTGHADKTRARGAMALKAALDAEYRTDKDELGTVRLVATKMKDAPEPEPMAFKPATVELGITDDMGLPVTSAVLDPTDYATPPKAGTEGRGKWQTKAMEVLKQLHRHHRENVEADGRDPDTARVSMKEWRTAMEDEGMPRQRAYDVPMKLKEQDSIIIEHDFVWPT